MEDPWASAPPTRCRTEGRCEWEVRKRGGGVVVQGEIKGKVSFEKLDNGAEGSGSA